MAAESYPGEEGGHPERRIDRSAEKEGGSGARDRERDWEIEIEERDRESLRVKEGDGKEGGRL